MVALTSSTLAVIDSLWVRGAGNLPALLRPGPRRRGICLMRASLAKKASYFLAAETQALITGFSDCLGSVLT